MFISFERLQLYWNLSSSVTRFCSCLRFRMASRRP